MIIDVTSTDELKKIFAETFLNKTDRVSKISPASAMNGVAYGVAKLSQKTLKDLSVIESHLFPDVAYGAYLDKIAQLDGTAARFGTSQSTTYIRIVGEPGTFYDKTIQRFSGQGVTFELTDDISIPAIGYCYAKVVSTRFGSVSNVDPLTVNTVSPVPSGHAYCINEYAGTGGRDREEDDEFRKRIIDAPNRAATSTIAFLEQVFRKINPLVLRVYNLGIDDVGDLVIGVCKVNGDDFTSPELNELYLKSERVFSVNELKPDGLSGYGLKIQNVPYFPIDVSVRVDLDASYNVDTQRKEMQINLSKKVDYRFWKDGDVISWIDLVNAIKSVRGVKRVLDNNFYPNNDIIVPQGHLPRFRGFILLNLNGQIIVNISGTLNPSFYPNEVDFNIQHSLLSSI